MRGVSQQGEKSRVLTVRRKRRKRSRHLLHLAAYTVITISTAGLLLLTLTAIRRWHFFKSPQPLSPELSHYLKKESRKIARNNFSKIHFEKRALSLVHQLEQLVDHKLNQSDRFRAAQIGLAHELKLLLEIVAASSTTTVNSREGNAISTEARKRTHYSRVDMSECPPLFGRVGVFVAMREKEYTTTYHVAQQSLLCYLASTNYTYYAVDLDVDPLAVEHCSHHNDIFFKKHCAASVHLRHRLRGVVDWLLVTDADSGVVYPGHCLEEWIDDRVELIFYERFFNWEIASGNYLVRNTDYAADFLMAWAEWEFHLPYSYHGWDNGAIHMHILQTVLPGAEAETRACQRIWERANNYATYMAYVTCVKLALGAKRVFQEAKLRIYRRAHAWVRDGWMIGEQWSERDFMIHGWKRESVNADTDWWFPFKRDFNLTECRIPQTEDNGNSYSGWHWRKQRRMSNAEEVRKELAAAEKRQQEAFEKDAKVLPFLVEPDIGECYPHCDDKT